MKTASGIILLSIIVLVGVAWWFLLQQEPEPQTQPENDIDTQKPTQNEDLDTSDWETYTNREFGFSLQHPPEWRVHEAPDDPIAPAINIYKPGSDTSALPFTHHTPDATHVSVYPQGIPTEGLFGETRKTTVPFKISTQNARDYLLENGQPYATFATVGAQNDAWTEAGFVFAGVPIEDHTFECFSDGTQIQNEECDPLMGDDIVHMGNVNTEDRKIEEAMLESFELVDTAERADTATTYKDLIRVETPLPESTVSSPLTVKGEARGQWYFEATFPIVLTDWDGRIIAEGFAEAQDEWMTEEYVPFEATLDFTATTSVSNRGSLILQKANASGLPEHDDAFEYTVFFENGS